MRRRSSPTYSKKVNPSYVGLQLKRAKKLIRRIYTESHMSYRGISKFLKESILVVLLVLIGLGDLVQGLFRSVLHGIVRSYNVLLSVGASFRQTVLMITLSLVRIIKPRKKRGRPPKPFRAVRIFYKQLVIFVRQVRLDIEALRLWVYAVGARIHLPRLRIPKMRLPLFSVKIPRVRVPKFQFRPPAALAISNELLRGVVLGVAVSVLFLFIPYTAYRWLQLLPNPTLLSRRDLEVTTKILDRNGVLLYEIYADQNRTPLPLSEIPPYVKEATIAIEDRDFYRHQGFSLRGVLRAARETIINKRLQGGSTITQQLIKSALLTPEISISRKLREIILAFWAERLYSKNQILEMYLNQVPYGGTAWGIEAASQTYFGKSVASLNLAEASLLAGLPAAPTEFSPFGNYPHKAFERQAEVLRRMVEDRYITKLQAEDALAQTVRLAPQRTGIRAPHFVMYVKELLERRYGPRLVERGGLRVTTSLDVAIQEKVEDIVETNLDTLRSLRVGNGAVIVTNPKNGDILAMVGSKDYFNTKEEGNVNVTTSLQQPGSAIKVVTYATALENGFTAATVLDDSPVVYRPAGSEPYAPVNYDGKFHGPTPLRYALGNSYNIPAVRTIARLGVETVLEKGRRMGIASWQDDSRYGLSLTLGGGEVTMLEMATVFGTLATGGQRIDLLPIVEVSDYTGKTFERNLPKRGMLVVKEEAAWILSNILSDNNARLSAFGPNSSLVIPGKTVSVKTGTSNDKRDNWTIGYTPSYVVVVWVGNNDNAPMNPYLTSGVTGAAPIWHEIMVDLLKDRPDEVLPKPNSVVAIPCYYDRPEYFMKGTQPTAGRCAPLPTPSPSPSPTP